MRSGGIRGCRVELLFVRVGGAVGGAVGTAASGRKSSRGSLELGGSLGQIPVQFVGSFGVDWGWFRGREELLGCLFSVT